MDHKTNVDALDRPIFRWIAHGDLVAGPCAIIVGLRHRDLHLSAPAATSLSIVGVMITAFAVWMLWANTVVARPGLYPIIDTGEQLLPIISDRRRMITTHGIDPKSRPNIVSGVRNHTTFDVRHGHADDLEVSVSAIAVEWAVRDDVDPTTILKILGPDHLQGFAAWTSTKTARTDLDPASPEYRDMLTAYWKSLGIDILAVDPVSEIHGTGASTAPGMIPIDWRRIITGIMTAATGVLIGIATTPPS